MSQIPTLQQLRSRLRIRHLVLLDELGRSLNMHRAAEAMHLSQPALSKLLAEAEELAGQTLFERSHHGVTPTPLGLMMIGRAAAAQRAGRDPRRADGGGQRRVGQGARGRVPVVAHLLAPLTVERLQASHPDLRIELREGLEQQLPALRAGELDCIVGRLVVEGADADLQCEILYEEATAAVCGPRIRWRPAAGWAAPSWTATAGCCRRATPRFTAWWPAPSRRGAAFRRSRWNRAPSHHRVAVAAHAAVVGHAAAGGALAAARGQLAILPLALQAKLHPVGIMTRRQARAATELFYRRARRRKWCAMRRRSASGLRRRRRRADAAAVGGRGRQGPFGAGGDQQLALGPAFLQPQGRQAPRPQPPLAGAQRQYADAQPGGDHLAHGVEAAHLDAQAQRQAGVLRRAREGVQQRAAPVQADEVIGQAAPEIGDVARGQRMVRRRHHHQPVAAKRHQVQAAPGHAGGADAQVGQAVLHRRAMSPLSCSSTSTRVPGLRAMKSASVAGRNCTSADILAHSRT